MVGVVLFAGAGISHAQEPAPAADARVIADKPGVDLPPELVPPAGNVLSSVFQARGVQIYTCTDGKWVFTEPAASLQGRAGGRGSHTLIHFRGPSWESVQDGSLVEAAVAASSPAEGTIPWLLLKVTRTRGDGILAGTTYVQRLATKGGAAPTGACTPASTTSVPYEAVYRFFTAQR
jgi:hypothetical protein